MNRLPVFLLALLLLGSRSAWAVPTGVQLYENGEYEAAVQSFALELAALQFPSEDQGLTRIYLAASLHALGRMVEVRKHLEVLAREHPELRVDPVRFLPELVELADVIHQQVEAELVKRAELIRQQMEAVQGLVPQTIETERTAQEAERRRLARGGYGRLRPEAVGFFEARGRQWALGSGLAWQQSSWELGAHVLPGDSTGFNFQGGVLLGSEALSSFLGLRASLVPGLGSFGGGPVVGGRLALPLGFVVVAEVGADYFVIGGDARYRLAITAQAGLGFRFDLGPR